jgi:adenylate cyclase class 2
MLDKLPIEYEATFTNVNKDAIRGRLKKADAQLIYPEFLQKRYVWHLPQGHEIEGAWLRVRQEFDKITLSLKMNVDGQTLEGQKELTLTIDNLEEARKILNTIGCQERAYQETTRELWKLDGVEITIDEWPFLEPLVEIEGPSEEAIKKVALQLDFDYTKACFKSADFLYADKYHITIDQFNKETPLLKFDMPNPFLK